MQPLFQWKSNRYCILWVCVCSLSYPACNAHAPHCHLWPVWLTIYFQIISPTIFEETYWTQKGVSFPLQFMSETFAHFKKNCVRYKQKCIGLNVKYQLFLSNYKKNLNFDRFSKNVQILWKTVQWKPSCSMRTDGRTDMMKLIMVCLKFANTPEKETNNWKNKTICAKS